MTTLTKLGSAAALALASAALSTSAIAADLGGNCCADLEERIAELEATTARKGNRKVKLEIFGQINTALVIWDDGKESNAYVGDNDFNSSRVGFRGTAKVADGWKAGYLLEMETNFAATDTNDQTDASSRDKTLDLRYAHWYFEHETFGKVTVGQTSSATDNLYKFGNITSSYADSELHYNGQFFLRSVTGGTTSTSLRWDTIANNLDTSRGNFVRYDTASLGGFVASAAWGDDDIWDVSLRYTGEAGGFKMAFGIGYVEDNDGDDTRFGDEPDDIIGSAGIIHQATGLYVHVSVGQRESDARPGFDDTAQHGYVQAGIEKKFNDFGPTTLFADYGRYEDFGTGTSFDRNVSAPGGTVSNNSTVLGSEVERFGVGFTQKFESAALDMYGVFNWYQADVTATTVSGGLGPTVNVPVEDWFSATLGSRIKF